MNPLMEDPETSADFVPIQHSQYPAEEKKLDFTGNGGNTN